MTPTPAPAERIEIGGYIFDFDDEWCLLYDPQKNHIGSLEKPDGLALAAALTRVPEGIEGIAKTYGKAVHEATAIALNPAKTADDFTRAEAVETETRTALLQAFAALAQPHQVVPEELRVRIEQRIIELTKKWGDPLGTDYDQGANDHGVRLLNAVRSLIEASPNPPTDRDPVSMEWCERMARLEGDAEIGAGLLARDPDELAEALATTRAQEVHPVSTGALHEGERGDATLSEAAVRKAYRHFLQGAEYPGSASAMGEAIELAMREVAPAQAVAGTEALREAIRDIPVTTDVITAVGKAIFRYLPDTIPTEDLGALSYDAAVAFKRAFIAEIDRSPALASTPGRTEEGTP